MNKSNAVSNTITIFIILLFFSPFLFPILESLMVNFTESGKNPFDYARITELEYNAVLLDEPKNSGKLLVTEKITFDIHAASKNNLFWELWRDLPEFYVDGVKVSYNVISVKEITDTGKKIDYEESSALYWEDSDYLYGSKHWYHSEGPYDEYNEQYECVFFYVDGIYRDTITFELVYEINNAALKYNDSSELYISMYDGDTIKYLKSFKGQILIPNKDMPSTGNYTAYTYGTDNHEFNFYESATANPGYYTFSFNLDEEDLKFKPYNTYLEFSLVSFGKDKHIFTEYTNDNQYTNYNVLPEIKQEQEEYEKLPQTYNAKKIKVFIICTSIAILIVVFTLNSRRRITKKYTFFKPTQTYKEYRDIPSDLDPIFAAHLVLSRHKSSKKITNEYSPLMLSLVRKKYIELVKIDQNHDWIDSNVKILIKYTPPQLIQTSEPLTSESIHNMFNQPLVKPEQTVISKQTSLLGETVVTITNSQQNTDINSAQSTFEPRINTSNILESPNIPTHFSSSSPDLEPLTQNEERFFNLILRHSIAQEISLSTFQIKIYDDCDYTRSFVESVNNSTSSIGVQNGYFQKLNYIEPQQKLNTKIKFMRIIGLLLLIIINYYSYKTRLDFAFGGYTILGIVLLLCSTILKKEAKEYTLLTQLGEDEFVKWNGLYNYLKNEQFIKNANITDITIWEKYLVYAAAFGLSNKVIKALNLKIPELENSQLLKNDYFRHRHYYNFNRHFSSTARTASHFSISGGHGGYGGGGRGGGGGGGGH